MCHTWLYVTTGKRLLTNLKQAFFPLLCASVMAGGISSTESCELDGCSGGAAKVISRRLKAIKGDGDKMNDVIFCGDPSSVVESNVVFFGGDVQDYKENMLSHRDNHRHQEWDLESTAQIIQKRFPKSHVWVVKPSKMHLKTFSVYQNFVDSNDFGAPMHNADHGGLKHLGKLLQNAVLALKNNEHRGGDCENGAINSAEKYARGNNDISNDESFSKEGSCAGSGKETSVECSFEKPLILVAFSKGCIVLNQVLYELEKVREDADLTALVERIHSFYWLDGGHSGGSNTWIVHQYVLKNLVSLNVEVFVHVTPYQIKDEMRAWIGKEERKFVDRLKKMGVKVTEIVHFEDDERSLCNHFKVLVSF